MADIEDNQDLSEALSQTQVDQDNLKLTKFFQKLPEKRETRFFARIDRDDSEDANVLQSFEAVSVNSTNSFADFKQKDTAYSEFPS